MSNSTIPFPRKSFIDRPKAAPKKSRKALGPAHFLINKQSAVPFHIQLKEQVRYAIMSGVYEPGSPLPSIREMTAQLGIHRNTVHRVYLELQASGLLVSRPGKGVFVNESLTEVISMKELNAVDELIEDYFRSANKMGINPSTLARLVGQRAPGHDSHYPIVAFVECTAHQSQECARDLGEAFGINVLHLLLDDLRQNGCQIPESVQHIVTSIFHFDEVSELPCVTGKRVHPITYDLHSETRKVLREVPAHRKLGFICNDANTEEVIGVQVKARVPEGTFVGCANIESAKHALELIGKVDTVILTEAAAEFCIKNCTPDHELLELHFALNQTSVNKVTRTLLFEP
ncbi:MAG: GntR family transcriptional regulator [SAR324 cluster bacterium]|nr:GntR family transcriptional regulator [SAR324 cluster bacterium]